MHDYRLHKQSNDILFLVVRGECGLKRLLVVNFFLSLLCKVILIFISLLILNILEAAACLAERSEPKSVKLEHLDECVMLFVLNEYLGNIIMIHILHRYLVGSMGWQGTGCWS